MWLSDSGTLPPGESATVYLHPEHGLLSLCDKGKKGIGEQLASFLPLQPGSDLFPWSELTLEVDPTCKEGWEIWGSTWNTRASITICSTIPLLYSFFQKHRNHEVVLL